MTSLRLATHIVWWAILAVLVGGGAVLGPDHPLFYLGVWFGIIGALSTLAWLGLPDEETPDPPEIVDYHVIGRAAVPRPQYGFLPGMTGVER